MAKCKNCGGNNAKKLSVVEKMGTETGTASTTGIGVSGGGVGVGFGKTSINKKSDLAREASFSPSDEAMKTSGGTFIGCTFLFFGEIGFFWYAIANDYSFWVLLLGIFVIGVLCIFLVALFDDSGKESKYSLEQDEWERTWMCLDCGHKWVEPGVSNFASPRVAKNKEYGNKEYRRLKLLQKSIEEKANKKYSKLKKEINKKEKEIIKKTRRLRFTKDKNIAKILNELEVLEKEKDKLLQSKAEEQKYDELKSKFNSCVGFLSVNENAKKRKESEVLAKEIKILLDSEHKWVESGVPNFDSPREATNKKYSELKKEINKKEKEIIKKTQQMSFTKNKKLKETIKKELEVLEKENDKLLPKKAEIQKYDELEKEIDRITGQISFTKNKELKETFKKELEVLEKEINKSFS